MDHRSEDLNSVRPSPETISQRYAWYILKAAANRGIDTAQLCRKAGLKPIQSAAPDEWVEVSRHLRLWELAAEAVGDPAFPMEVADLKRVEPDDVLHFACMTSASLHDALGRVARYLGIHTHWSRWRYESGPVGGRMTYLNPGPDGLGTWCSSLFSLTCLLGAARRYTGRDLSPQAVHFAGRPVTLTPHLEAFFRAPLSFGASRNELLFRVEDLSTPMLKADALLSGFFERSAEGLLRAQPELSETARQVERVILAKLQDGTPSLDSVAEELDLSSRTLRRRLVNEGAPFQSLLDSVRRELADRHLQQGQLSLGEIAFLLGFSEVAAFHRAYRRWTGHSPRRRSRGQ